MYAAVLAALAEEENYIAEMKAILDPREPSAMAHLPS
ncbi:MAG: hypothetical protein QOF51_293 [Chloroflexota bacterium]|jgi:hypothetical protein|nr:hypothetical protein [Chloroflexota bacterium]